LKIQRKTIVTVILTTVLTLTVVWGFQAYLEFARNPTEEYDYIVFQDGTFVKAKNGKTGNIDFGSFNASYVLQKAIDQGNTVYIKGGEYVLTSDVILHNKKNARVLGDGSRINFNGSKLIIRGDDYTQSQHNLLSGLEIINGTLRIENSFKTTITSMVFRDCSTALEFENTETWSEGTEISDSYFINSSESIVFRTPVGNATGSYSNTEINRCYFNLYSDNAVGINVETEALFTDSLVHNVRIWMGEFGQTNMTGLSMDGSMLNTLMQNVVFESFADSPYKLYGVSIGQAAEPPILGEGVSFLGKWSARVYNPFYKWVFGSGGVFKRENVDVTIGLNNEYGPIQTVDAYALKITGFQARIRVSGTLGAGEMITVRFRLELIDNAISGSVQKSFNQTATVWLENEDLLALAPSENVIWSILIDAKTNSTSTNASVKVDLFGATA
jgi:hypothetical protein